MHLPAELLSRASAGNTRLHAHGMTAVHVLHFIYASMLLYFGCEQFRNSSNCSKYFVISSW